MSRFQQDYSFQPFRERITWAVQTLILANVIIFAAQLLLDIPLGTFPPRPPGGEFLTRILGFNPRDFLGLFLWQPFSYMFLHAGLLHLFMNMLWLYIFGPEVERLLGTRLFFRFYVACGALGVLATFIPYAYALATTEGMVSAPSVIGASGATMGVLIAFAMINPERQFFLFPLPVPINARFMVIIVIALNLLQARGGGNVSVSTHFGGMAVGYLLMKFIPRYRSWQNERRQHRKPPKGKGDDVGKAVDNIFRFDDRKRGG
jgi:membrane associated rhomboid family serine protease